MGRIKLKVELIEGALGSNFMDLDDIDEEIGLERQSAYN